MIRKITPKMLEGLNWIAEHEPVALFPENGPSRAILKRLREAGLVEECGRETGMFGCTKFIVSKEGEKVREDSCE